MAEDIKILWDKEGLNPTFEGDIFFDKGDLTRESGLETAVLMSIFTNRRAEDDDILPDENENDRQGWWGDLVTTLDNEQIGSRMWLLDRAKTTDETLADAEFYLNECLEWMIDDGVAQEIDIEVERQNRPDGSATLASKIKIYKSDGTTEVFKYDDLWTGQFS